jgi:hypothetical protein
MSQTYYRVCEDQHGFSTFRGELFDSRERAERLMNQLQAYEAEKICAAVFGRGELPEHPPYIWIQEITFDGPNPGGTEAK